jgi:TolB-like protein
MLQRQCPILSIAEVGKGHAKLRRSNGCGVSFCEMSMSEEDGPAQHSRSEAETQIHSGRSGGCDPAATVHDPTAVPVPSPRAGGTDGPPSFGQYKVIRRLGEGGSVKEYLIGTEVYERKPPYHPGEDSIVRSEARRLRRKLKEYYESDGKDDSVLISYRPGSYVPVFSLRELFSERRGIRIAVLPFVDASRSILSGECARFITDDLVHELVRTDGLRVTTASSVVPPVAQALDIPSLARKLDVHVLFGGTVREENNQLRVSVRVVDADGFHILSERFETESDLQGVFKVSEKIVSELISRVLPEQSQFERQPLTATMLAVNP